MIDRLKSDTRGSFTVEAAIVVSVMILVLAGIVFFAMIAYQKVILTGTASMAAQQGAQMWVDSRKSVETGAWNESERSDSLYYHILGDSLFNTYTYVRRLDGVSGPNGPAGGKTAGNADVSSNSIPGTGDVQGRKMEGIEKAVCHSLSKGFLKPAAAELRIEYRNTLIQRTIRVTIAQEIRIPFGWLKNLFDQKSTLTVSGTGTAVVSEPAEYIRNVDLLLEYASRIGDRIDIKQKIDDMKKRIFKGK